MQNFEGFWEIGRFLLLLLDDILPVVLKGGTEVARYAVPMIAKIATQYFVSNRIDKQFRNVQK